MLWCESEVLTQEPPFKVLKVGAFSRGVSPAPLLTPSYLIEIRNLENTFNWLSLNTFSLLAFTILLPFEPQLHKTTGNFGLRLPQQGDYILHLWYFLCLSLAPFQEKNIKQCGSQCSLQFSLLLMLYNKLLKAQLLISFWLFS